MTEPAPPALPAGAPRAAQRLLAALGGAFVFYVGLVLAMPAAVPHREVYADVAFAPFSMLALVLLWQAARTGTDRHRRRGLQLLAIAQLSGIANQALWILASARLISGDSSAFEVAGLAMTACTVAGLLFLVPGRGVAGTTPVVPLIDALLLALASVSVGWHFVGVPVLGSGVESARDFLWLATIASGDLFACLLALSAWAFTGQRLRSSAALALTVGFGMTATMDLLLEVQSLAGTYRSGGTVDVVYAAATVCVGLAAYLEQRPGPGHDARSVPRASLMRLLLPAIAAAAMAVPVVLLVITPHAGPERFVPLVLLILFLALGQWRFVLLERDAERALTRRLSLESDLRLSQQFESLGRYAASVAHDMGNLLATLTAQVHIVRITGERDAATLARLADMEQTLGSGTTLTRRLMQMSRGGETPMEPVDITRAARNMAITVRALLPNSVRLTVETDRDPVIVSLHPGDADHVLLNLVVNARDALPQGGQIIVRVRAVDGSAVLEVSDDGEGIASQLLSRVFEPFFTTRGATGGTGLGLATVKSIVAGSHGTVDVCSTSGQGARFVVRWPLAQRAVS